MSEFWRALVGGGIGLLIIIYLFRQQFDAKVSLPIAVIETGKGGIAKSVCESRRMDRPVKQPRVCVTKRNGSLNKGQ